MSTIKQYRIDKSTETIYEYDESQNAYMYLTNFISIGATWRNRESTIVKKLQQGDN
jgi:hypothetical protein